MSALQTIPTTKIAPSDDNPRGAIDTASEAFAGLCVSIKAVGILQPILVGPANGNGKHTILDGHRRHAAAIEEKVKEIPVMVLAEGVSERVARLTANIQREDFSPVAEARAIKELQEDGLTQVQAADILGKSERWVRERLRLLGLPEKVQEAYTDGALPLESLVTIEKIAGQAPKAAEALAEVAATDQETRVAIGDGRIGDALGWLAEEDAGDDIGCMVQLGYGWIDGDDLERAGLPPAQLEVIQAKFAEAKQLEETAPRGVWVHSVHGLSPRDVNRDEAKSFGCLLEIDKAAYITDAPWLADRLIEALDKGLDRLKKELKKAGAKPKKDDDAPASADDEKAAKEERKRQREAEQQERAEIRANNLELGQRTEQALRAPKLSLEEAKLLALMVIGNSAEGLGARGLIYCYHDFQDEEQLKNGRTKVTYETGRVAGDGLLNAVHAAKKPDEAIGLALRAIMLASFADQDCVAPSNRSWYSVDQDIHGRADELIQAIAIERKVLPEAVCARLEEERQRKAEEAEHYLLARAQSSRAKTGIARNQLLIDIRVTPHLIDAAVDAKRLKELGDGDDATYTITAAGKKRLEKLKAAEKERQAAK
jgi:ParB/RepB/Spo0J family partition protein